MVKSGAPRTRRCRKSRQTWRGCLYQCWGSASCNPSLYGYGVWGLRREGEKRKIDQIVTGLRRAAGKADGGTAGVVADTRCVGCVCCVCCVGVVVGMGVSRRLVFVGMNGQKQQRRRLVPTAPLLPVKSAQNRDKAKRRDALERRKRQKNGDERNDLTALGMQNPLLRPPALAPSAGHLHHRVLLPASSIMFSPTSDAPTSARQQGS